MATITGLTADRMQQIIDKTIVSANIVSGHLILTLSDGSTVDAGVATGATGAPGIVKVTAFPSSPADGDLVIRTDQAGDPVYKYTTGPGWVPLAGGLQKVTAFPSAPVDGDGVVRTDLNGSPIFMYSTENGWEQTPRMGAVTVPAVKVYSASAFAVPNNVATAVPFDSEEYDTDSIHDLAVNTTRLTVKTPGLYNINGVLSFGANNTGQRELQIKVNDVIVWDAEYQVNSSGTDWTSCPFATTIRLAAGDYVEFLLWQNASAGATINTVTGRREHVSMTWLGGPGQTVDERGVPSGRLTNSVAVSIPNGVNTAISFDTELYDTDDSHSLTSNTTRFTCKTPGVYRFFASYWWASVPGSAYTGFFVKNGDAANLAFGTVQNLNRAQTVSGEILLAAGDYVEFIVQQGSGGALNVLKNSSDSPIFGWSMTASGKTVTPYCHAQASATLTNLLPNTAWTAIPFNSEFNDNDGIHDTVSNTTRLTCRTAGVYIVQGHVIFANNATGTERRVMLSKNGSEAIFDTGHRPNPSGLGTYVPISAIIEFAVGDYIELLGYQDSGAALSVIGDPTYGGDGSHFKMVKIGAPNAGPSGLGSAQADVFTVATLPPATSFPNGRIVGVSDGAAGQQARMAMAGAWLNLG